jgi:hypothetical protein
MQQDPRWPLAYQLVVLEADQPRTLPTRVWIRRDSTKLGFLREPDRIVVPGFMLAHPPAVAREDGHGRLGAMGSREAPVAIRISEVPPGPWLITATWSGAAPEISAQADRDHAWAGSAPLEMVLDGGAPTSIDVALRPRAAGLVHIRQLELRRVSPSLR